jgi:hypothetical protein
MLLCLYIAFKRHQRESESNTVIRIYTPKLTPMKNIRVDISYRSREPTPFVLDIPTPPKPPRSLSPSTTGVSSVVPDDAPVVDAGQSSAIYVEPSNTESLRPRTGKHSHEQD